jgi:protein-disulfide isomerase
MVAPPPQLLVPVTEVDHAIGPPGARVTLVEYGDFECPHCAAAYPIVRRLLGSLGNSLRFAFRHYPIVVRHDHAQLAAEASEAAAAQGKFWPMHDLLFEHQEALDLESLVSYAARLGLDLARFRAELEGRIYAARVYEQMEGGEASGVSWTPTFFINGGRYGSAPDLEGLAQAVTEAAVRKA